MLDRTKENPVAFTTVATMACGAGAAVLAGIGLAQGGAELAAVQYGALGLAGMAMWFNRVDARERERRLGRVIDQHESHMTEMLERSVSAINRLCDRPCMSEGNKPKEKQP
jgi:hypothetical protein